jgi:hypothetical protein
MFKDLFLNWFNKKYNNQNLKIKADVRNIDNNTNYILISSDKKDNYEPYIKIHLVDLSKDGCEKFSEILFHLNRGEYHQSFIDLLLQMGDQDHEIKQFVQSLIIYWGILIKQATLENNSSQEPLDKKLNTKPLISPTDFNKNVR